MSSVVALKPGMEGLDLFRVIKVNVKRENLHIYFINKESAYIL